MKDWDLLGDSFVKLFSLGFLFALGVFWSWVAFFRTDTLDLEIGGNLNLSGTPIEFNADSRLNF